MSYRSYLYQKSASEEMTEKAQQTGIDYMSGKLTIADVQAFLCTSTYPLGYREVCTLIANGCATATYDGTALPSRVQPEQDESEVAKINAAKKHRANYLPGDKAVKPFMTFRKGDEHELSIQCHITITDETKTARKAVAA